MIGGASLPELIVLGGAFALIGSWGMVRLPSLMERLHGPIKATSISRPTISMSPR
jgi:multicomponent K+:H+ antiporter subunit G